MPGKSIFSKRRVPTLPKQASRKAMAATTKHVISTTTTAKKRVK